MQLLNFLFGRPLATSVEHEQRVGVAAGIPIFGFDNLTSAAYGPELAMTLLGPMVVRRYRRAGLWPAQPAHYRAPFDPSPVS
ncbi:MAG TPA: hypothetical protein VF865_09045 [Acidobacteriaceae bacterium]